jgi:hypothetical protein
MVLFSLAFQRIDKALVYLDFSYQPPATATEARLSVERWKSSTQVPSLEAGGPDSGDQPGPSVNPSTPSPRVRMQSTGHGRLTAVVHHQLRLS